MHSPFPPSISPSFLVLKAPTMASSSFFQGEEGVDPILEWQDPQAHPSMPDHFIGCPLSLDQLKEYYSLPSIGGLTSFYLKQEKAMTDYYTNPPLTKAIPIGQTKKAKASMTEIAPSTMETRVKVMREFVGFAHKWLHLPSTMEHALNPQVVAKYFGFHVAKGNQEGYLKTIGTNLHQASMFVASPHCPKSTHGAQDDEHTKATMDWYTNLNGHILASISSHYQAKEHGITLWSAWQAVEAKWGTFLDKFKVSGWLACLGTHAPSSPHPLPTPSHPSPQKNKGKWNKELARECQEIVLAMMVVGLYQPPMRVGALRLIHNYTSSHNPKDHCLFEHCK